MDNTTQKPGNGKIWCGLIFCWVPLVWLILYSLDIRSVVKYCKDVKGEKVSTTFLSILCLFIFPAYIWKRNKLLETSQASFYVSLALIIFAVIGCIASAAMGA